MMRFVLSIFFIIMAVALFFSQTQPYFNDIKALRAQRQEYQTALANSRELQTLRDDLLSRYNAISQENLDHLNKLLPGEIDSGNLIVMFENRAKAYGLLLKKVDVKEAKQSSDSAGALAASPPPYKIIDISLLVSGSYAPLLGLLDDLGKDLRLIDVNGVNFSVAATDVYEFTINARAYYLASANTPPVAGDGDGLGGGTQEILAMLTKLKSIKIDSDFFNNNIFKSLSDFTPALEAPKEYGRVNPFAPF